MTLEEYFGDWIAVIDKSVLTNTLNKVSKLYQTQIVCPKQRDIFKVFEVCPYKELKVIFLGQDVYPQKGVATGIAFGNNKEPLSPSLEVLKEACIDYTVPHYGLKFDNTLESWARQGVLLLNASLTVELNKPGSHSMVWRDFISSLLRNISEYNPGLIYVLFGKEASTFKPYIKTGGGIIEVQHPAWYARTRQKLSHHLFIDLNNRLKQQYGESITWFTEL